MSNVVCGANVDVPVYLLLEFCDWCTCIISTRVWMMKPSINRYHVAGRYDGETDKRWVPHVHYELPERVLTDWLTRTSRYYTCIWSWTAFSTCNSLAVHTFHVTLYQHSPIVKAFCNVVQSTKRRSNYSTRTTTIVFVWRSSNTWWKY